MKFSWEHWEHPSCSYKLAFGPHWGCTGVEGGNLLPWADPKSFVKVVSEFYKVLSQLGGAKALLHGLAWQQTVLGGSSDRRSQEKGCAGGV